MSLRNGEPNWRSANVPTIDFGRPRVAGLVAGGRIDGQLDDPCSARNLSAGEKVLVAVATVFVALKLVFAFGAPPLSDESYCWM